MLSLEQDSMPREFDHVGMNVIPPEVYLIQPDNLFTWVVHIFLGDCSLPVFLNTKENHIFHLEIQSSVPENLRNFSGFKLKDFHIHIYIYTWQRLPIDVLNCFLSIDDRFLCKRCNGVKLQRFTLG